MFLTLEDPNAKIKGSRDPLGAQAIWTAFGRQVIANLTTQTNSARGFTILLLGRYLAERAIEDERISRELALDAFLCFEQVGAYVRHVGHGVSGDIRGIERVRSRLHEHGGLVPIRADASGFILGDQRVNGLWGLFSVSARVSRLIPDGPVGLTPNAKLFVEREYLPTLQPVMDRLLELISSGGNLDTSTPDAVFSALRIVLSESFTAEERQFYGEYIRDGRHVRQARAGLQRTFCKLLANHVNLAAATDRNDVEQLREAARSVDPELANRLNRIARVEAVLAPSMVLFDFILARHHREVDEMTEELHERWEVAVPNVDVQENQDLLPAVASIWGETSGVANCFQRCQQGLATGNYGVALRALLQWHRYVMNSRGGAPWVVIGEDGALDVRYRAATQELPTRDDLGELWRNGYFIDSLKGVTRQLGQAA